MQKAVIVGVFQKSDDFRLREVEELARNSGYLIVDKVIQIRSNPHAGYLIGPGKLRELKDRVKKYGVKTVLFANELKPGQYFRLQKELGLDVNILDRVLLILDIFDKRAFTSEAKLQIELARLKYTLPWARELVRLKGFGSEKMGFGSLGSYPYEAYISFARKRIKVIEERLERLKKRQEEVVIRRKEVDLPIVALTGYTQSGKTTLFNLLAKESKVTGLGPFTTLETCARRVDAYGKSFIIVDSLGFIDEMPQLVLDAFHATLVELRLADVIALLIDVSEAPSIMERKLKTSLSIVSGVAGDNKPLIVAANKMDLVGDSRLEKSIKLVKRIACHYDVVPISAKKAVNVSFFLKKIVEKLGKN
ncbi:MAG: GTPase HflX [Candidatus Verstraetearchaeota archaeon]|nr:GTPase HflX [Candidatus Verstraetearchaeota archaeon]